MRSWCSLLAVCVDEGNYSFFRDLVHRFVLLDRIAADSSAAFSLDSIYYLGDIEVSSVLWIAPQSALDALSLVC